MEKLGRRSEYSRMLLVSSTQEGDEGGRKVTTWKSIEQGEKRNGVRGRRSMHRMDEKKII